MTVAAGTRAEAAQALLIAQHAQDVPHPGGTLLEHLLRVRGQLAQWGATEEVQLAGLCHAVYGTDGFGVVLLEVDRRQALIDVIGGEAEDLVYLYGSCDRSYAYPQLQRAAVEFRDRFSGVTSTPSDGRVRAFAEITAANELDVVRHSPQLATAHGAALQRLFAGAGDAVMPVAVAPNSAAMGSTASGLLAGASTCRTG